MWLLGSPRLALVLLFCCTGAVQSRRTPPNSSDAAAGGGRKTSHKHHGHLRHEQHRRAGADATKASDHLVTKLPGLQDGALTAKQYAGYIPVNGGKLFYWLFESANKPALDPLVIWLNGGPGCSSMDGLFLENGPLQLTGPKKKDLTGNMYSWHNVANVLYVDQPVGTGLSITADDTYADSEAQVDANFYAFLQGFMALHPSLASRALYFTGESHAGHYIPSMIVYILDANAPGGSSAVVLNVKGAAIGNGWTAPRYQYDVSEYAFGAGLVAEGQLRALQARAAACRANIDKKNYRSNVCYELLDAVVEASGPQGKRACIYDVRRFGYDFPPGRDAVQDYLNRADVRAALHVADDPAQFKECTDPPFYHLAQWDGLGVMPQVASILEAGQRLLFFNGQHDLICNHVGNERWLSELSWSGAQAYRESDRGAWVVESGDIEGPAGYYKKSANNGLAYLLVRGAGHMVPMDVPKAALDMLTRFLNEKSFVDYAQVS
ncbi:Alpha/Beta hydrolase protein [Tribonema minus]|uniref:Alpha/Beta hydrolase protein n=1 Tax=Tribonema minus TaxID=303371 RepID=A0A835YJ65_9STRA|nr:Alpha/Beta hydrolase protein [Tribonema minus]